MRSVDTLVRFGVVCVDLCAFCGVGGHETLQGSRVGLLNHLGDHMARGPVPDTRNSGLANRTPARFQLFLDVLVAFLTADIGLVGLNRRNLIMPGFWARRWRLPIPSTHYAGVPRSSSPISFTTAVAI